MAVRLFELVPGIYSLYMYVTLNLNVFFKHFRAKKMETFWMLNLLMCIKVLMVC